MNNEESGSGCQNNATDLLQDKADKKVMRAALKLVKRSKICMLGTMGEEGYIDMRAMLNLKQRGLQQIWFSTNTSSKKIDQIKKDPRACVYYVDETNFEGLRLTGRIQILQDSRSRKMLWSEGFKIYYPLGLNDPDYTVLKFTAQKASYYSDLNNITFEVA